MIRLHPLEIRAISASQYSFKFRGESGDIDFPFEFEKEQTHGMNNLKFGTQQFMQLTHDDASNYLVDWCLQQLHLARQYRVTFNGTQFDPVMYKYCGEPSTDVFKYSLVLQNNQQNFEEQILVDYSVDDNWVIKSSQGHARIAFNTMAELQLVEPKPTNAYLLQSILYFDELRYFKTSKEGQPFKVHFEC